MSNSNMLLCLVFLFFSFGSSSYFSNTNFNNNKNNYNNNKTTITSHECSTLLLFKQNLSSFNFSMVDPYLSGSESYSPVMMNWNTSTTDCCDWDGVTCNHSTGDVIGLDLSYGMLQGTLHPSTPLFNLSHLQTLNLAFNDFFGSQIPPEIGRFSNTLTHLNISGSGFFGKIPSEIRFFNKLVSLDLSSYNLHLEPRVFISLLQNNTFLEELSLRGVNISSVLPTHLNMSSSLKLLNLYYTGLHGKLPPNIFNLQSLETLVLSTNKFTGQIPWEISRLPKLISLDLSMNPNLSVKPHILNSLLQNSTHLRYMSLGYVNIGSVLLTYLNISSSMKSLDLSNTNLKGKLPDNIFNQQIETLDLSENENLIGPLPKVNDTAPLKGLRLSFTNLTSEIPNSFGNFKSLTYLDLSGCGLTGSIPRSMGNLRHLTSLSLSINKLNGTLPSFIFTLQSLNNLELDRNQFHGQIDVLKFQQLTNLTELSLGKNNFSGTFELDTLLSSIKNIRILELSYSGLSLSTNNSNHYVHPKIEWLTLASCKIKVFPESLRFMTNLRLLDLSNNEIHGQIPQWAREIGGSNLYQLDLSHNFITGLPEFQMYGIGLLFLQSNLIQGPFPLSICKNHLYYLDLSNNRFDGEIPQCFGNITSSLIRINLGKNLFHGTIPNVYGNCGELEELILKENHFEGDVPSSLSNCQSLKVLDMGNNHLNGKFPHWLESLPNLQVLVLKLNKFHGEIVPSSTVGLKFPSLQVIDLSHNGFEGQLPRTYFQKFNAMMNNRVEKNTSPKYLIVQGEFYTFVATVKGVEQYFSKLYVHYTIVCVSHNNFVGQIPEIIGNLNSLVVLDLSHNSFTGQIPNTLGKLSELESLDLSFNQLTGKIPQSLVDLMFLEFLNLSQNHLVGLIPVGNHLNTFQESSFEGNLNLCGIPLPKKCNGNPQDSELEGNEDGDEEESGFTWRLVKLGYGCGTLIGLVMGYFMLSTGRPLWFNAIADIVEKMILKR